MNKTSIKKIFQCFKANNDKPTTELKYKSQFELLISVMLSAQATDVSVNRATQPLYKIANTPQKILGLGEEGLKRYIKTIGLYNTKASNIIKTCQILVDQHSSRVPKTRQALEALPGVGRKTANVVLNTAFGETTIAVDTHIFRVSRRIGLADGKTPLKVEQQLLEVVPREYLADAHHWLILHGRYTCVARKPRCQSCIIYDYCEYQNKSDDT